MCGALFYQVYLRSGALSVILEDTFTEWDPILFLEYIFTKWDPISKSLF